MGLHHLVIRVFNQFFFLLISPSSFSSFQVSRVNFSYLLRHITGFFCVNKAEVIEEQMVDVRWSVLACVVSQITSHAPQVATDLLWEVSLGRVRVGKLGFIFVETENHASIRYRCCLWIVTSDYKRLVFLTHSLFSFSNRYHSIWAIKNEIEKLPLPQPVSFP